MCPWSNRKGHPSHWLCNQEGDNHPASHPSKSLLVTLPEASCLPSPTFPNILGISNKPITLRLFKQTAAQFPGPEPQLRDSLGSTLTISTPHPKPLSGKSSPSTDNDSALTVGTFARLNVCRHLVKCPRPSFQRTIPPRCVCLSRQSQIRRGLPPFSKSQECKTEARGNAVGGWGKFRWNREYLSLSLSTSTLPSKNILTYREWETRALGGLFIYFLKYFPNTTTVTGKVQFSILQLGWTLEVHRSL